MGSGGRGDEVVHLEEAVKMLMDHLVRPVLPPVGASRDERHRYMTPEKQQAVAQQIHTAVILYNYYHRKMFPQLDFADANQFLKWACIFVGQDLHAYLTPVQERGENPGEDVRSSVTYRAAIQACQIAAELDARKDSPDMATWPISKVAVLLLDQRRKNCLIGYGAKTKCVWSIIEREFDAAAGISHTTSQPAGQKLANERTFGTLDEPDLLLQLAFSEVESRTGMKTSDLRVLDETLAYSLSKERTTTKLFIVEYKQIINVNFWEMSLEESLEDLISRMTGPVFANDPFPKTTSVVEYYHILPYKEILFELLHRKWPAESSLNEKSHRHGLHSVIDGNLEEQDTNRMSKMRKLIPKVSTPKQNKRAIKATGANSNQNYRTRSRKQKKNNIRKFEASRATSAEGPYGVQVDKNKTQKICGNMLQDGFPTKAPCGNPVMENNALGPQNMEVTEKSDGVTENNDYQVHDSLRPVLKIRDEMLHKERILQERNAQCDMDIQTILKEGKMTPKVLSIIDTYKEPCSNILKVANSSCTGNGVQTMSTERKTLREALDIHNKCQELDKICNKSNWIAPRYTIEPLVADGKFRATVHLQGPDFEISTTGSPCLTVCEARRSAAVSMIIKLHRKREEEEEQDN